MFMINRIIGIIVVGLLLVGIVVYLLVNKQMKTQNSNQPATISQPTATSPTKTSEKKSYSLEDIAEHNKRESCWMAINGKVYDVTKFVGRHPGGTVIATGCGKDASVLFNLRPNTKKMPHPEQAQEELAKLYIGELK